MHEWFYSLFVKSQLYTIYALNAHIYRNSKLQLNLVKKSYLDFIRKWKPKRKIECL